jgi:PPM family protein phosphatase
MSTTDRAELERAQTPPDPTPPPGSAPVLETFGLSDVGRSRERNEDVFLIATLERALLIQGSNLPPGDRPHLSIGAGGTLMLVADGMGGMGGGDVASRVAVASVADYMLSRMPWVGQTIASNAPSRASLPGIRTALDRAIHAGDDEVRRAAQHGPHPDMGTTLTLAYVLWPRLYLAHAGDSRCYLYRGGALQQLTHDHSIAKQIEEAGMEPVKADSALQNVLWNALGGGNGVEPQPEIQRYMLAPDDLLLLCTDGLVKHVPDESIARVLASAPSANQSVQELVNVANAAGGSDNITVVVARFSSAA